LAVSRGGDLMDKNPENWTEEDKERINEKFISDGMGSMHFVDAICHKCIHVDENGVTCKAFPDGIPVAILNGEFDHHKPHPDDNGIQFEKNPDFMGD